jgi:hypothetical protein
VSVCALWQGTQRLSAVIVDDDGELRLPITVPATSNNAHHLLTYLATAGIGTLIIAESNHILIAQAHALNLHVRLVPHDLLEAIRTATGLNHRPPRNTAILLARWYLTPILRLHLREFRAQAPQKKQLALF